MRALVIELRKEKWTGVIPVLLAVGILGAAYAFVNFLVRKDTLLNLPLAPMDVLLTQLYGMIEQIQTLCREKRRLRRNDNAVRCR